MNHNKRECKDAISTGVHAYFPQVFISPLYFSFATSFCMLCNSYRIRTEIYTPTVRSPFVSAEGMPSKDVRGGTLKMCPGQQKTYCASLVSAKNISAS